jgi:hypothetical protein
MSRERSVLAGIGGLPVDEAVDAVVAADATRDAAAVRRAFDHVTDDGVVTAEAFDETVSDVSKVVSTAETRTELADIEFGDAESAAVPYDDVATVAARLDDFGAELDDVTDRAAALTDDLQAAIARPDDAASLYRVVADLREVASTAQSVQLAADHLQVDLEAFQRWVGDHDVRAEAFGDDLDAVAEMVDGLADAVGGLDTADGDADDPGAAWADAALRHRVTGLLLADLRAEIDDLRTLAERQDADPDFAELDGRLDALDDRRATLGDDLDVASRPAWVERYGDDVDAFEAALDDFEPPVSWGAVRAELDAHRPDVDA